MRELKGVTKAGGIEVGAGGGGWATKEGGGGYTLKQCNCCWYSAMNKEVQTTLVDSIIVFFCSHCVVWRKEEEKKKLNVTRIRWRTYWFPM